MRSADELAGIRAAAATASAAQAAVREAVAPGITERALWEIGERVLREATGGAQVVAEVDLMAGERTELVGAPPSDRAVASGDPVLFDLASRFHGFWADSCSTFVCGRPGRELRRRHDAVRRAFDRGLCSLRAGVRAGEVDAAIRGALSEAGLTCPHHMGHGVGRAPQEPPWLVPGDETELVAGMTVAVEPGCYGSGIGIRLEHLVLVSEDGCEPLTTHSIELT